MRFQQISKPSNKISMTKLFLLFLFVAWKLSWSKKRVTHWTSFVSRKEQDTPCGWKGIHNSKEKRKLIVIKKVFHVHSVNFFTCSIDCFMRSSKYLTKRREIKTTSSTYFGTEHSTNVRNLSASDFPSLGEVKRVLLTNLNIVIWCHSTNNSCLFITDFFIMIRKYYNNIKNNES